MADELTRGRARKGPAYEIDALRDLTRMALDVVALCTMNYRFNSFYSESETPAFVTALNDFLGESDRRGWFPDIVNRFRYSSRASFEAAIATMRDETAKVIQHRRTHGTEHQDLLSIMMSGKDPETGKKMSDDSLVDNVITFLGAGHETTSGTLAFSLYHLVKNPWAMSTAQQEIDSVLGDAPLTVDHLAKLPYIDAIIRETLRLTPTVGLISLKPEKDEIIGGKYFISKDDAVMGLMYASHRDPKVYGEDADIWKPERMLVDNFKKLPPNAWKPFGNGVRACIGRPFAWQEIQIVSYAGCPSVRGNVMTFANQGLSNAAADIQLRAFGSVVRAHQQRGHHAQPRRSQVARHSERPTEIQPSACGAAYAGSSTTGCADEWREGQETASGAAHVHLVWLWQWYLRIAGPPLCK